MQRALLKLWSQSAHLFYLYLFFPPTELMSFKQKRIAAFRKNLIEMAELEIKHAKVCSFWNLTGIV